MNAHLAENAARDFAAHSPLWDVGKTSGDCWTRAGFFMLANYDKPDAVLVHAEWLVSGEWTGHAWCEVPATATYDDGSEATIIVVVDGTQPDPGARYVPRDIYFEHVRVRNERRYTFAQMVEHALKHGHDGPWQATP
jgi:hypothetical protein